MNKESCFPVGILLFAVVLGGFGYEPAFAIQPREAQSIVLYFENDVFAGTDKNYSSASRLAWVSEDLDWRSENGRGTAHKIPLFGSLFSGKGYQRNISVAVGQNIYTPKDKDTRELLENDRPYAGLLYFSFALHKKNIFHLDTFDLSLGVVGPASLAEETQKWGHELIGSTIPKGWDNQLKNEPGMALAWQHNWRLFSQNQGAWGMDIIPHLGLTLGNFTTFASTGAGLRMGYHIPHDFGVSLLRPAASVSVPYNDNSAGTGNLRNHSVSAYLFISPEARFVARNIFLDGNTWKDSHSVDKKNLVADLAAGFSLIYRNVKFSYTHVYRTKEYDKQKEAQTFGSVNITFSF